MIWVLIVGALTGIGKLIMITHNGNGDLLGDRTIPRWFVARRTPSLNHLSLIASNLGATQDILIVSVVTCVVFLAVTRRWRPVIFIAVVMFGELGAFLMIEEVVKRPRPDVPHLDSGLPTSAFPSGHMAATTCLYVAIAILVIGHARGWWRYLFLIPAIVMPVMIATARMYRGEHHPTDILASVLFAALWLTAATMLIKPNEDAFRRVAACRRACAAGRQPIAAKRPRRQPHEHGHAPEPRRRVVNPTKLDDDERPSASLSARSWTIMAGTSRCGWRRPGGSRPGPGRVGGVGQGGPRARLRR